MYGDIVNFSFIILISLIYAFIEIEIEGKNGWMKNLPTPNIVKFGDKNMTLYHLYMLLFVIIIIIYQNQTELTINSLLYSASNVLLFLFLEDTLWFIYNPYFTIKKYNKKDIWWHSKQPWILGLPMHNYTISIICILISYVTNNINVIYSLLLSYAFTGFSILIAPYYHTIYNKLHNISLK